MRVRCRMANAMLILSPSSLSSLFLLFRRVNLKVGSCIVQLCDKVLPVPVVYLFSNQVQICCKIAATSHTCIYIMKDWGIYFSPAINIKDQMHKTRT
jgi:hypothetical protein